MPAVDTVFEALMATICDRRDNPTQKSYTSSLMKSGVGEIGRKVTEEAQEVVEAAMESGLEGRDHLIHEAADLLYHLFVMLGYGRIELQEVANELQRRFGTSGLDEKRRGPKRKQETKRRG